MIVKMCDRCHKKIVARERENDIFVAYDEDHSQREYYIVKKCDAKANEPISRNMLIPSQARTLDLCDDCYANFVKFAEMCLD